METDLFSKPPWNPETSGLDENRMGIDALRTGLSNLFCNHIRKEFPVLIRQTRKKLDEKRRDLEALGPARSSFEEQQQYLQSVIDAYQIPKQQCLHDDYRYSTPNDPTLLARKMAFVKKTNFRDQLERHGPVWKFQKPVRGLDMASDKAANELLQKDTKSIYTWINDRYQNSKGCEVPALVPYRLLERLFEEQTVNWVSTTQAFAENIKDILHAAVIHCLTIACTNTRVLEELKEIVEEKVEAKIAEFLHNCLVLIEQHRHGMQIVACETSFVEQLNQARTLRLISAMARLQVVVGEPLKGGGVFGNLPPPSKPLEFMLTYTESLTTVIADERQIIYQIHDILHAYYNLSCAHYIETVCKNLLSESFVFQVMDLFSADLLEGLSEGEVESLAGESAADKEKRRSLVEEVKLYEMAIREAEEILKERF
jgi:hypothetical protein